MNSIKQARINVGLSQKEVAITLGVSSPTVSEWEAGKKTPTVANIKALSKLYGVSADVLLDLSDENLTSPAHALHSATSKCWSGHRLSELRKQFGETPEQVARRIGITSSQYKSIETAQSDPSIDTLFKLSEHFCCDIDTILGHSPALYDSNNKICTSEFKLQPEEKQLVELYRILTTSQKDRVMGYIDGFVAQRADFPHDNPKGELA